MTGGNASDDGACAPEGADATNAGAIGLSLTLEEIAISGEYPIEPP